VDANDAIWCAMLGKTGRALGRGPTHHPLVCHLFDTAAVSEHLWDEVLPDAVQSRKGVPRRLTRAPAHLRRQVTEIVRRDSAASLGLGAPTVSPQNC